MTDLGLADVDVVALWGAWCLSVQQPIKRFLGTPASEQALRHSRMRSTDQYDAPKGSFSWMEKATHVSFVLGRLSANLSAGFTPAGGLIQAVSSYPNSDK